MHVLARRARTAAPPGGGRLFRHLTRGSVVGYLRVALASLYVTDAELYRTHDFRRGHAQAGAMRTAAPRSTRRRRLAQDLVDSGAPLVEILRAGRWRSPSFFDYVEERALEDAAIVQAHADESSEEEDE